MQKLLSRQKSAWSLRFCCPFSKHDCKQVPHTSNLRAATRFWGSVQTCPLPTCSYLIRNRIQQRKRHLEKAFDPLTVHALNISETLPSIYISQSARGSPQMTACMPTRQLIWLHMVVPKMWEHLGTYDMASGYIVSIWMPPLGPWFMHSKCHCQKDPWWRPAESHWTSACPSGACINHWREGPALTHTNCINRSLKPWQT